MNQRNRNWRYDDVDAVEIRLEMDDPLKEGISLTGRTANEFPEKYTWTLKVYEEGQDGYHLEERDIGEELLEDGEIEDFPSFCDVGREEVGIDRQVGDDDTSNYLKEFARSEAHEMAETLREEQDLDVEVNTDSFYAPKLNFSTRIYV